MPPSQSLPLPLGFDTTDDYIASLLAFSEDPLFQTLCGGVHILDFFTRDTSDETRPQDLYHSILPQKWIDYFATQNIHSILVLLMRRELDSLDSTEGVPKSLLDFIRTVRGHSLRREFVRKDGGSGGRNTRGAGRGKKSSEWALHAGMKPKKVHEVENFSSFVDNLVQDLNSDSRDKHISHILDFGSGQAYLSRTLAKKYGHSVVGIESRLSNIIGAQVYDERFEALEKKRAEAKQKKSTLSPTPEPETTPDESEEETPVGSLQYIEKRISSDNLSEVVSQVQPLSQPKNMVLISLHSCGNLVHHALRSFLSTPSVRAVALIGCCYNLLTEKLSITHQPPFRELHPRLIKTSTTLDPQGFPMSELYTARNLTLNITARMMACQAPQNWTEETSEGFFGRHFYRALLQRIFYDRNLVSRDTPEPVIIGSLRKKCYTSFWEYVVGAREKLGWQGRLDITKEEVEDYERRFWQRKKDLSVVWSLMAFTAGVVESLIVVDRWVFLREAVERGELKGAWVEVAFEYRESPRNLVVVGVR